MARDSVFYKLAKDENSFTELLCNLLMRDEFRTRVMPLLIPESLASSIPAEAITTQEHAEDCGRPDIVIQTSNVCLLVEVKLNPRRGLTAYQEPSGCEENDKKRYSYFLSRQNVQHKWLVFLVPANWIYSEKLHAFKAVPRNDQIQINICYWEHILGALQGISDPILEEFRKVLMRHLALLTLSPDELQAVHTDNFPNSFRAIRKSQIIIDQIAESQKHEWEKKNRQSYGFYLGVNGKCKLWFGLWEVDGLVQLCYAISHYDDATETAFRTFFQDSKIRTAGLDEKWILTDVAGELLRSDDPVRQIRKQIDMLLNSLRPEAILTNSA
jgi:hypothetical protein